MAFSMSVYDVLIVCFAVLFSVILPRLHAPVTSHAVTRLVLCVLVVVLCVYLPKWLGVPLALLLVLSAVPVVRIELFDTDTEKPPSSEPEDPTLLEAFVNVKNPDEFIETFSQKKQGEKAIAEKMKVFTRINSKQKEFSQQLANIQNNLKGVREFYANEDAKYKKTVGEM
jgi:hypothetical protein